MAIGTLGMTDNEAIAPGQVDDDFKMEVMENLRRGRIHRSKWRVDAREDYDFYAGVQWDENDASKLQSESRPAVVFNRIVRTLNSVSGLEIQNRQEVKYYPRDINPSNQAEDGTNDSGYADVMNAASKWVRDQNNSEDEESEVFNDLLICGEGWTETRMDYEVDPQGMVVKDRIDPLEMVVDPDSSKKNYADAKWVAHVKDYSLKQIKAMFPKYDGSGGGTFWNDLEGEPHDAQDAWMYKNDQSDKLTQPNRISVVQYQYYITEDYYLAVDQTQQITEVPSKVYEQRKKILEAMAIKVVKMKRRVYKQVFIVGDQFFDHEVIPCREFTLQGMTGLRDRNRNLWFGLVALMKDPQRWANKWLSQIQYILNTSSKNAMLVEAGAVVNRRKLEDNLAQPGAVIDLNPGGLQKIQELDRAQYPDGIDRLLNYAIGAINDIPGVNLELIGMADRNQPIGLEMQRKNAGVTVLAVFFDALRRYRKTDGKILASYIRDYLSDGRLIRITGQSGANYIPLVKSKLAFEYDIVIDDAPTSPNSKERNFLILSQIVPMVMQAGIPVPPDILDYAPLPDDLIQKWKQTIEESSQVDPEQEAIQKQIQQIQMLMMQLDAIQAQADIQKTGSETAKNYAAAEKDRSVGQEQAALAMQKFGIINGEQQLKAANMRQDQDRKNTEMMLTHFRKMLEMQLETKLKAMNMGSAPTLNQIN